MFFEIFVVKEDTRQFFWEIIAWISFLQSIFVISSFSRFMKLIVIYVESSFHVIPSLTWKWFEFIIFFYLTIISLWVTIYTFPITQKTTYRII